MPSSIRSRRRRKVSACACRERGRSSGVGHNLAKVGEALGKQTRAKLSALASHSRCREVGPSAFVRWLDRFRPPRLRRSPGSAGREGHCPTPPLGDGKPVNHQLTDHLSITQSQVPSSWRRATSEVMSPSRLRVEVRARSPQTSAGRCSPSLNLRPSGPNPVTWSLVKNS